MCALHLKGDGFTSFMGDMCATLMGKSRMAKLILTVYQLVKGLDLV